MFNYQPERMFHSLSETWNGCMNNSSDLKELIPELFYLPSSLVNTNALDLGVRQDGTVLNHVQLPRWCHNDSNEFVRLHREALESDYVSSKLHEWIDLIFGYKQTGEASIEANNVFYYLTYEDAVDIDAIEDPIMRRAVEVQIANFGQCPSQLFVTPHPSRNISNRSLGIQAVQIANTFLQERIGRGGYDVIRTINSRINDSLPDGSNVQNTFEKTTSVFGQLLEKAGGIVSGAMNAVTETVTAASEEKDTIEQHNNADFQQKNLHSSSLSMYHQRSGSSGGRSTEAHA